MWNHFNLKGNEKADTSLSKEITKLNDELINNQLFKDIKEQIKNAT